MNEIKAENGTKTSRFDIALNQCQTYFLHSYYTASLPNHPRLHICVLSELCRKWWWRRRKRNCTKLFVLSKFRPFLRNCAYYFFRRSNWYDNACWLCVKMKKKNSDFKFIFALFSFLFYLTHWTVDEMRQSEKRNKWKIGGKKWVEMRTHSVEHALSNWFI